MTKTEKVDRLTMVKENLAKYKMYDGDHEEGYDGHQEWNGEDDLLLEAIAFFYKAVKKRYFLEVRSFLAILMPNGADDGRLPAIQHLLTNTTSEEALKEALLCSIATGSRPLVEFVLALFVDCPFLERSGCANSASFPPHMTPLMLACILNNFSIVQCLLLRGHTIQTPHFLTCECSTCKRETVSTGRNSRIVDVMRALSSESFLWLATDDVFAAACSVAQDLQKMMDEDELEHVEIYRSLEANVQRFTARLSDQAWRTDEFSVLVGNKNHCPRRNTEISSPRLQMAMDSHMRQFTCTTNSQSAVKSVFRSDWFNFGNKLKRDTWRVLRVTLLMPFLCLLHAVCPHRGTTMSIPYARFMAHICAYVLFLATTILRLFNWNSLVFEGYMYAYIFGLALERALLYYRVGADVFFAFWWRWFDTFLISAFLLSCLFLIYSKTGFEPVDASKVDRVHWPSAEYDLFHEIFLSIACVLGISKCFYYLQIVKGIGGSVISVGKCVGKVYTYIIIMILLIFSFSVGLNVLVGPYLNRESIKKDGSVDESTTKSYGNLAMSTKNLFWSIFGYLGPSTYVTAVGNAGRDLEPAGHPFNSATLEILGGLFHGIIIITILNLMISLLVKKADEVLDNEEMEFKYTRAAIYAEFLSWEMAAPPPFNLFLVPMHLVHRTFLHRLYESPSWGQKPVEDKDEERAQQEQYMKVLLTIFKRFVAAKECKYKSIWRSEFDKEEKQACRVAYLSSGTRPASLDNTFEGVRWRNRRKMEREANEPNFHVDEYYTHPGKGMAREKAMSKQMPIEKTEPPTGTKLEPLPVVVQTPAQPV
ncbi:unnamed protein product [Caenorhabditis sp. 36 PRJEB53466]|nr:unnamed protein product [Caenorhabditis sp. 36 PRJEB53466]